MAKIKIVTIPDSGKEKQDRHTFGGTVKWHSYSQKQFGSFLEKQNMPNQTDPAIALLHIFPEI